MRILLTADPEIPVPPRGYGGIERIVDALARGLRARGHEVALAAHPDSTAEVEEFFPWPGANSRSPAATIRNALALRRAARRFRPDVLHSFSRLAYLAPLLPSRRPTIMSYQRPTGPRSAALAVRLGGRSMHFTGCSEFICAQGRPGGGTWRVIPNFVDLPAYDFRAEVAPDAPLVFLGRLEPIKGPDLAIQIARAAGRRLLLAGNVPPAHADFFRREIEPWIGRDGIEFRGEVNDTQKNSLLGSAAALLAPIRWDEPFGIVFAEALACGTPVISHPRGALPEIIADGIHGFLVRAPSSAIAAVSRLGSISRHACREQAEKRFSAEVCVGQYLDLYREITA